MTPTEALNILAQVVPQVNTTLQGHQAMQEALHVLSDAITPRDVMDAKEGDTDVITE